MLDVRVTLNKADNVHAFRIAASIKISLAQYIYKIVVLATVGHQIDVPVDECGNYFDQVST
jgi:hypothetical protein